MHFPIRAVCLITIFSAAAWEPRHVAAHREEAQALSQWSNPQQISPAWGGGYARLLRLQDGSLLGTVAGYKNNVNHLRTTHSTDNGATWVDYGEIDEGVGDIDNIHTIQLPYTAPGASAPRILAAFRNHTRGPNGTYAAFRITVCRSDDGGKTWAFHSEIENSVPPFGLWEPFLYTATDGSLHVYYAREYAADNQDIVMKRSTDGGQSWGPLQTVAGGNITSRDGMPGVATYFDGAHLAMLAIFESESGGIFHVMSTKSIDSGRTWSQRATIYAPAPGRNAGSPQIASIGHQLVAVFMTDEDSAQQHWPDNAAVKAVASTGIGQNQIDWTGATTVSSASSYWPGVIANGHASALITFNKGPGLVVSGPVSSIGHRYDLALEP